MRVCQIVAISAALWLAIFLYAAAQDMHIKDIISNDAIYGRVTGLEDKDYFNYKVVVHVHTDRWYVHPYAGQGEGKSWASLS
jgi:hypothetical protein